MPRVHRKKKNRRGAERHCGQCDKAIKPGDEYFTWSFRYGGARFRCIDHPPRPSDLTQSKLATVYVAVEGAEDGLPKLTDVEQIEEAVRSVGEAAREVADEYEEAAEPFGNSGENQDRADELGGWADELEDWMPDDEDADVDDVREEARELIGQCPL